MSCICMKQNPVCDGLSGKFSADIEILGLYKSLLANLQVDGSVSHIRARLLNKLLFLF